MLYSIFLRSIVATLATLSPVAQAIQFSYPESADNAYSVNLAFVQGDTVKVTWNTVSTDPKKFSLYLWEFVNYPPAYELVAYNVDTAAKEATFKVPCHIKPSSSWQLYEHNSLLDCSNETSWMRPADYECFCHSTMIEGTNVYVIYAQTARFKIKKRKGTCVAPPPHPEICSSSSSYDD